jgi:hypothetical protein
MADVDKKTTEVVETPAAEEVAVDIETPNENLEEEFVEEAPQDFYANLADDMDARTLQRMATSLIDEYKRDRISRKDWETAYTQGLDLLGFKYTEMQRPFRGSANVTHPLLAEAVTQFQAQAYKELLPSDGPVKCAIVGDETPEVYAQSQRVQGFMNYMLMDKMQEYTPEFDQLLFFLPLAGSAFKKVYYDAVMERAVSKFVPSEDLVVPYYATDLLDCERITHVVKMSENEVLKKQKAGFYLDIELKAVQTGVSDIQKKYNDLEGVVPTADRQTNFNILEMHVDLDLEEYDIERGKQIPYKDKQVKVPYIVTLTEGS